MAGRRPDRDRRGNSAVSGARCAGVISFSRWGRGVSGRISGHDKGISMASGAASGGPAHPPSESAGYPARPGAPGRRTELHRPAKPAMYRAVGPRGGVVTQRTANPFTGVRFPPWPPRLGFVGNRPVCRTRPLLPSSDLGFAAAARARGRAELASGMGPVSWSECPVTAHLGVFAVAAAGTSTFRPQTRAQGRFQRPPVRSGPQSSAHILRRLAPHFES